MSASIETPEVILAAVAEGEAAGAVALVEAHLVVVGLHALSASIDEKMVDARVRERGDRAWHAQMQDQLNEAQRRSANAQRALMKGLMAWEVAYRPGGHH